MIPMLIGGDDDVVVWSIAWICGLSPGDDLQKRGIPKRRISLSSIGTYLAVQGRLLG